MPLLSPKSIIIKRIRISQKKLSFISKSFAVDLTALQVAKLVNLNRNTVNRYLAFLRQLIISAAIEERQKDKIGNGVEID